MDENQITANLEEAASGTVATEIAGGEEKGETISGAEAPAALETAAVEEKMTEDDLDNTVRRIKTGDRITGRVIRVDKEGVMVDIGYKSEGVIPAEELSHLRFEHP
ncbi:MAG: S1 RNA-binding domain-containing protein, partial [Chloroflexi bacterium]|nr:S1 RNA-binding domain-containing protein [Chloroflexota bacterium]